MRKIASVFAYLRVRDVVETIKFVRLWPPFVSKEIFVALLTFRYFALILIGVSLAFRTVLAPVRQVRKIVTVFAYRRVGHVVEAAEDPVRLISLFVMVREIFVALLAFRYFALMMIFVSLAFRTVLVQPPGNA